MSSMKKALAVTDAVVTVSGPVGVGKTTIVGRALDAVSAQRAIARIGRMRLGREEVLELLLTEFDVSGQPTSTIQRFHAFKHLLNDWAASNTRVFIVIEDATHIGIDALIELESLTSSDAGDTPGANLVLMGQPGLQEFLKVPALARLRQRVRLRQSIAPFSTAEVRGYLAHRLRQAGGDLDTLCDAAAVEVIHRCSEGIPRVINNLCEAALTAAAEAKVSALSPTLIAKIARDQFGYDGAVPVAPSATAAEPANAAPPPDESKVAPTKPAVVQPSKAAEPPAAAQDDFEVPEFIQDTMPELKTLELPEAAPSVKYSDELMAPSAAPNEIDTLRGKTDDTQPSLPVLTLPEADESADADAAALDAEQQRIRLEPRVPEPLSKDSDPADTQTIKALDSALRPDTQLLRALEELPPETGDDAAVPLGLQGEVGETPPAAAQTPPATRTQTEKLPTLSDSMRLDSPPAKGAPVAGTAADGPKKPDIDALEAALAVARKGPIDLNAEPAPAAPDATPATPPQGAALAPPAQHTDPPVPRSLPEITLDDSLQLAHQAAQAKLAEEEAEIAAQKAAEAVKKRPPETEPAEKADFSGLSTITEQLDAGDLHAAVDAGADAGDDDPNRRKLEKVAAELGTATSLEDIDDLAAETLFGEEFSQLAAQAVAMAANDMELESEPAPAPAAQAAASAGPPLPAAAPATPVAPQSNASNLSEAPTSTAAPKTVFGKPDIDSSAARRLEMVRSLNQNKKPMPNTGGPVEIVLGDDDGPAPGAGSRIKPEPIENQFGTSMTATLEALSTQSIKALQEQEEEEEKKGGLLSRFKRS